jgi:hypothetical protein
LFYQHPGDANKPYLAQYSGVISEVAPVNASYTTIKTNQPTKTKLKLANTNFKILLIGIFLLFAIYMLIV